MKRLYRNKRHATLGGVCHGIADYFGIDPTLIRLAWAVAIFSGVGFFAYFVAWIIIPEEPY